MAGHVKSNIPGKPAPNLDWLKASYGHVQSYLRFKYPTLALLPMSRKNTAHAFDQLVNEGRLLKERWNKRAWIGYNLTLRLVSRSVLLIPIFWAGSLNAEQLLTNAINHGCVNFDTIVSRALSMTLMAAAGNRAGDVAQILRGHENCFVSYGDVTLVIWDTNEEDSNPSLEQMYANLVAGFDIYFAKGHK